jgi:hypothetical protein
MLSRLLAALCHQLMCSGCKATKKIIRSGSSRSRGPTRCQEGKRADGHTEKKFQQIVEEALVVLIAELAIRVVKVVEPVRVSHSSKKIYH